MATPNVKVSLKSQILQRRGNLKVDFTPKPAQPMSQEEIEKDKRRKESNKNSAKKSRLKLKELDEMNQKKLDEERDRKSTLIENFNKSIKEKQMYVNTLINMGVSESIIKEALNNVSCNAENIPAVALSDSSDSSDTSNIRFDKASMYGSESESYSTDSNEAAQFHFDALSEINSPDISCDSSVEIPATNIHIEYGGSCGDSQIVFEEDVEMLMNIDLDKLDQTTECSDANLAVQSDDSIPCISSCAINSYVTNSELLIQGNYPSFYANHMAQLLTA